MWRHVWMRWLIGMAGCLAGGGALAGLVALQDMPWLARGVALGGGVLALTCLVGALLSATQRQYLRIWLVFVGIWVATGALAAPLMLWSNWLATRELTSNTPQALNVAAVGLIIIGALAQLVLLFWAMMERRGLRLLAMVFFGAGDVALIAWLLSLIGFDLAAIAVIAIAGMTITFTLLLRLVREAMSVGHPVFGVARTLIDEAVRMKVAMVFVVLLILLLGILPLSLSQDKLADQIQRFITYSLMAVGFLLGLMTVFLACATITGEISRKQIFLTMTKPIGRFEYLVGKWLGIALLNFVLLLTCGAAIYSFAYMLRSRAAGDPFALAMVDQTVLTSRQTIAPQPASPNVLPEMRDEHLQQLRADFPDRYPARWADLAQRQRDEVEGAVRRKWLTIGPTASRTYVFRGLDHLTARQRGVLHLRIKPRREMRPEAGHDYVYLTLTLNDSGKDEQIRDAITGEFVPTARIKVKNNTFRQLVIPLTMRDATGNPHRLVNDGVLRVTIKNDPPSAAEGYGSVQFKPGEGIELLYPAGSFETNYGRSLLILWVQMAMLAAIGLAAGSALSFPVAVLVTLATFLGGTAKIYLGDSFRYWVKLPDESLAGWDWISAYLELLTRAVGEREFGVLVKLLMAGLGKIVVILLPGIGVFDPTELVASGKLVSWEMTADAVLWLGVIWGGLSAAVGWMLFSRRELAVSSNL